MTKFSLLLTLILLLSCSAFGAPMCVSDSLASYIGLDSAGCEIGTATFSGFGTLPLITGADPIAAAAVTVSPFQDGSTVGLDFQVNATAMSGQLFQAIFGYTITGPMIFSDSLRVSGVSAPGGAFATAIQDYCAGGMFLPNDVTGCTGTAGSLLVVDNATSAVPLAGVSMLNIVNDITLDAGSGGSATGGLVSNRFSLEAAAAVPEPQTYVLMSSALIALAGLRLSKRTGKKSGGSI